MCDSLSNEVLANGGVKHTPTTEGETPHHSQEGKTPNHSQEGKVPHHTLEISGLKPQISIEDVDFDEPTVNNVTETLNTDQKKLKSYSLPAGLVLDCAHGSLDDLNSDLSDLETNDFESSGDIDKDSESKMAAEKVPTKQRLVYSESVNSTGDFDMSSDDLNEEKDNVFTERHSAVSVALDKQLTEWACKEFIPSCQILLQKCSEDCSEKSDEILYHLRNLSNRINYFCMEQQRLSGQLKRSSCISSSISTDQMSKLGSEKPHPMSENNSISSEALSGRESGESIYDHRSYAVKVLKSVSQQLISPLLTDSEDGFNEELYQAIVQAIQKIAWKVEACLSYNDPTKQVEIHSEIFTQVEQERVRTMMVGAHVRSRAGSVVDSDSSPRHASEPVRIVKRTTSGRFRPGGAVFDSGSLPEEFKLPKTLSGDSTQLSSPSKSLKGSPLRSRTATLDSSETAGWKSKPLARFGSQPFMDKDGFPIPGDFAPEYLRSTGHTRRTTVSLSHKEVTLLGLTVAKRVDETIATDNSSDSRHSSEGDSFRDKLHLKLTESFDKLREAPPMPLGPYARKKSASLSNILDESPPLPNSRRHDSDPRTPEAKSPSPFGSPHKTYIKSQRSDTALPAVKGDWILVDGKAIDPRVARSLPGKAEDSKQKKQKKTRKEAKRTTSEKLTSSGKFSASLHKTAAALRRFSSVNKNSRTENLEQLAESAEQYQQISEPTSPRAAKSDTMPSSQKRKIKPPFFRVAKSFSNNSLSRRKLSQKSGFLDSDGQEYVNDPENGFTESIVLQYSEGADIQRVQQEAEKELLISVDLSSKSSNKKKSNIWFEITVTTNIKQFGRNHYSVQRPIKQILGLYDDINSCYGVKLPDRPDKKKDSRKVCQQIQDLFRFLSGNQELRESGPLVAFLTPDFEFGNFNVTSSEVNFELIMTFYTPDQYPGPPGSHRDLEVVLPENTPSTPSPPQARRSGTLKRGTMRVVKNEGKEEGSTFVIREEDRDALIVACEDERYVVVAGTFEKLVERLACDEKPDSRFVSTLLLGYRHFSTPVELLTGLLRRFHLESPPDATEEDVVYTEKWRYLIQLRVLDILTYWMTKCWPDFYRNRDVLDMTNQFIEDLKSSSDQNFTLAGSNLEEIVREKLLSSAQPSSQGSRVSSPSHRKGSSPATPTRAPKRSGSTPSTPTLRPCGPSPPATPTMKPTSPGRSSGQSTPTFARSTTPRASQLMFAGRSQRYNPCYPVDVNTLTAIQLARQLTLIELELLKLVSSHELAVAMWESNTPENKPYRKNLDNFIARFNQVSYWVASEICTVLDPKARGALIEKFIEMARQCQQHRNYNTTISLVTGLSLAAVRRLKKSWEFVGEKSIKVYQKLHQISSPLNNHGNYRKLLATAHRRELHVPYFCIPYLGVIMRDLTFFNDGNAKKLKNGLINFSKLRTMVLKFEELKRYQRSKYPFPPEDRTREFCRNLWSLSETDLYEVSLEVEPREVAPVETDV